MKLVDPQDLHDARKRMTHKTNNDADEPAANNDRRTPDDALGGGGEGGENETLSICMQTVLQRDRVGPLLYLLSFF